MKGDPSCRRGCGWLTVRGHPSCRRGCAALRWRLRRGAGGAGHRDSGAADVEIVGLSVLILLPVIYLALTIFQIQRAAFGVTQAAREAGRAFATAASTREAFARAQVAAQTALADQGVDGVPRVEYLPADAGCGAGRASGGSGVATLRPGATFVVCVRMDVPLPYTSAGRFAGIVPATVAVTGQYEVVVDEYRRQR